MEDWNLTRLLREIGYPISKEQLYQDFLTRMQEEGWLPPKPSRKRFKKPTAKEVNDYAKANGYQVDGQVFVDYNDGIGWVVGKTQKPMKDWQAAVRTWHKNGKTNSEIKLAGAHKPYKPSY